MKYLLLVLSLGWMGCVGSAAKEWSNCPSGTPIQVAPREAIALHDPSFAEVRRCDAVRDATGQLWVFTQSKRGIEALAVADDGSWTSSRISPKGWTELEDVTVVLDGQGYPMVLWCGDAPYFCEEYKMKRSKTTIASSSFDGKKWSIPAIVDEGFSKFVMPGNLSAIRDRENRIHIAYRKNLGEFYNVGWPIMGEGNSAQKIGTAIYEDGQWSSPRTTTGKSWIDMSAPRLTLLADGRVMLAMKTDQLGRQIDTQAYRIGYQTWSHGFWSPLARVSPSGMHIEGLRNIVADGWGNIHTWMDYREKNGDYNRWYLQTRGQRVQQKKVRWPVFANSILVNKGEALSKPRAECRCKSRRCRNPILPIAMNVQPLRNGGLAVVDYGRLLIYDGKQWSGTYIRTHRWLNTARGNWLTITSCEGNNIWVQEIEIRRTLPEDPSIDR